MILTNDSVHWFKKTDGLDLFGEERGHVRLDAILTIRILDEDSTCFDLQTLDGTKRIFRASSPQLCEEWISGIRSAMKRLDARLNKQENSLEDGGIEVSVLLISLKSHMKGEELVLTRNPSWGHVINIPTVSKGDVVILSISTGGYINLTYDVLIDKAEDAVDFDVAVQGVPLASSLRVNVSHCVYSSHHSHNNTSSHNGGGDNNRGNTDRKVTRIQKMWVGLTAAITSEANAVTLILSIMVLLVGISTSPNLGPDTSLLFVFATLLACYNIQRLVNDTASSSSQSSNVSRKVESSSLTLIILSHAFTSPDAPINALDDDIPQRFIDGCEGELREARRRWDITRRWRETEVIYYSFQ